MPQPYDALIIGGGHNGLVCGAYLAKAGLKVAVLERRPIIGGAAVTEEIYPGFRASIFSYLMSLLHPRIIRDLELARHGLEVLPCSDMFSPMSRARRRALPASAATTPTSILPSPGISRNARRSSAGSCG